MSNKPTNADLAAELLSMKKDNEQLSARISELHKDIRDIKVTLLDPDHGAIARVNRNTEFRETTSKALWVVYAALVGIIVKIFTGEI
jgi:hypothetical protein